MTPQPPSSSTDPLALFERPARLGTLGDRVRTEAFGEQVWVRPAPSHEIPAAALRLTDDGPQVLPAWPEPSTLRAKDRLVVQVAATPEDRVRYVAWLGELSAAAPSELSLAPCSATPGGMHRLWCIGAARVLLPGHVRIEARHDLIGIRLAQLAVGFGADTLAGPIEPDRRLPLAGVTRPDENTPQGLHTLVRQVGLRPQPEKPTSERTP